MNNWLDLEHHLWKELKERNLQSEQLLVGFSGGVDSLALLWACHRVKKTGLVAGYIHHGPGENAPYRDFAETFCKDFCRQHQIPFYSLKHSGKELTSEEALRDFRHTSLEELRKQTNAHWIALAHHREDLLETRLLRLIRGTGPQGLVSMQSVQGVLFRPFLRVSKKDLQIYLEKSSLTALEDPSNRDLHPFRNWLRQEWLVALEKKQKGAVHSLARSLEILAEAQEDDAFPEGLFEKQGISRGHYLALSKAQQQRVLAHYLLRMGQRNFSQSHLEEIQKRLDISQKVFIFKVGGIEWVINAEQIRVQKAL